ncbi:SNF2 family N-terminal domain-containing protein [Durotheca rogersii]|uniref:SNF2 family N-terminal domain-containing protein n=1 Tax=Durotheca rogersii TaxID=419775 RepID=UPI0022208FBC|nr:SNF2 family N-terminal domain-containing protein [Durotheca rogersii]KAI5867457.1 SNF2 family N-terminal domain-containing protein [Durotheca rogersii]
MAPSSPPDSTEAALLADIELQKILCESLKGTVNDTPEQRAELRATSEDLTRKLKNHQSTLQKARKRTYSAYIGPASAPQPDANKALRTLPDPSLNAFDGIRPLSVTQNEWIQRQGDEFERFRGMKRRDAEDAAVARRLDKELNPPLTPSSLSSSDLSRARNPIKSESPTTQGSDDWMAELYQPSTRLANEVDKSHRDVPGSVADPLQALFGANLSCLTSFSALAGDNSGHSGAQNARKEALCQHEQPEKPASLEFTDYAGGFYGFSSGSVLPETPEFETWNSQSGWIPTMEPSYGPHPTTAWGPRGNSGSLTDIIKRTNGYDYTNSVDGEGNPLPRWLAAYENCDTGAFGNGKGPAEDKDQIRNLLSNIKQDTSTFEQGPDNTPESFRYPLYKHQQVALRWMENMELDENKRGGILADDMGLGKTLSTLALMTNLIVAPLSLLRQWNREIEQKLKPGRGLSVFILHGKKTEFDQLRCYDVVLTTYGTLSSQFGKMEAYIRNAEKNDNPVDNGHLSALFPLVGPRSFFYRIIFDEAQFIKNYNTKTAKAASHLQGKYRWCLSGTPMMNGPKELASLVHFLRIKPYCDLDIFHRKGWNGSSRNLAMQKLQALLTAIMLRRTKTSKIDGKPIIELKEKLEVVDHVVFDEDERQYYQSLEKNSRVEFSKYLAAGTIGRHYAQVLVLLLRLRQACCHPYLHITDLELVNPGASEGALVELAKALEPDVIRRLKEVEAFDCPICLDGVESPSIMFPCGHYICSACLAGLVENLDQQNIRAGQDHGSMQCPTCRGNVDTAKVINYDIFKKVHMPETVEVEEEDEDEFASDSDDSTGYSSSVDDGDDVDERGNLAGFVVDDSDDDVAPARRKPECGNRKKGAVSKPESKSRPKRKKDEEVQPHMLKQLRKNAYKNHRAHKRYMRYLRQIWLPSAKVTKCCDLISAVQKTSGEKIIVFSQWTILLDLLEIAIKDQLKLGLCRYDGSMSATQRDDAARKFTEDRGTKVILVSLKAGNAGLNLTAASQVIIMDPFWNPYIEMQAIDRTYRIGQQRNVTVHRILTQETVEDRIVEIQERKRTLVDSALDEKAAKDIGRLSGNDLAYLFGAHPDNH